MISRPRMDLESELKVSIKLVFAPLPFSEAMHEEIAHYIQEHDIGLVLVDTLPAWWGLTMKTARQKCSAKASPFST